MHRSPSRSLSLALGLSLALPWNAATAALAASGPEDSRVLHALSRLGYGPRPGDLARVRALGVEKWIEQQLQPERIADPEPERLLASLGTQKLSTDDLMKRYDVPPDAKREIRRRLAQSEQGGENDPEAERRQARRMALEMHPEIEGPPRQVLADQQQAKLLRAIYSERQLQEVMADFWFNHFNVFADKGPEKLLIPEYERDVIRPRALGRFEDLLLATARSPAMLFYLDNWLSVDPAARQRLEQRRGRMQARGGFGRGAGAPQGPGRPADPAAPAPRRTGLNENYARELLELHTLGVDGPYTQKDVTEVARCFTGWTIEGLREQRPRFRFVPLLHDAGDKVVLGQAVKGSGQDEGESVIRQLAAHPKTARFVSSKLVRRFVADEPPEALVERAAKTFERTGGDIREVLRSIFSAPEFWQAERAKIKTPLEFVVSAARATGAAVRDARDLARRVAEMGMPLYQQQPPTGYKDVAEAWVSTSGLLARLNFSLDLAAGRVRGVDLDLQALAAPETSSADALSARLVPSGLGVDTRRTLEQKAGADLDGARLAGLILGSPEFQRR